MWEDTGSLREFLAGHGIYVLGNDHLGHGKTRSGRKTGIFPVTMSAVSVIRDMRRVTVHAQKISGVPIFLLGHSMGVVLRETISDRL